MTANCKQRKTSNFGRHESSTSCMYIVIISLSREVLLSTGTGFSLSLSFVITRFLPQLLSLLLSSFLLLILVCLSLSNSLPSLHPSKVLYLLFFSLSFSSITDVGRTQSVDSKGSPPPPLLHLLPLSFLFSVLLLWKKRK